ncbi:MAG TPA: hypothetical protein VLH40_03435 [Atribacteraceae bacterium]|nr:hypothetical protein [Atribacteraceae bacterium]
MRSRYWFLLILIIVTIIASVDLYNGGLRDIASAFDRLITQPVNDVVYELDEHWFKEQ